jgi:hypothetical protein
MHRDRRGITTRPAALAIVADHGERLFQSDVGPRRVFVSIVAVSIVAGGMAVAGARRHSG